MKEKKKVKRVRVVKPNSINYTFTNDITILPDKDDRQNKKPKEKTRDFTRKTLKDLNTTKPHYKPNRSPKSQQGHSSVYE